MARYGKAAWHAGIAPARRFRHALRRAFLSFLRKVSETDDGRAILARSLDGLLQWRPPLAGRKDDLTCPAYPDLGKPEAVGRPSRRGEPILITGRFRSGSTFLWNVFRNLDGYTSYYEPFNERRWFDPARRGDRTDATHRKVSDYWQEYDGLQVLGDYYQDEWIWRNLYMDATAWNPAMRRYVELMIEKAPGRPALQFNRIDFRLPWFRHNFPGAKIVHLYRHPRDQWCSALMDIKCFPRDGSMEQFAAQDKFYLLMWASDLKYHFPFLDPAGVSHPYQLFYYIWKLSYLFGREYAHHSVAFEHLVEDPDARLPELFAAVGVEQYDLAKIKGLIVKPPPGKWKEYADEEWFRRHEAACETNLAAFLAHSPVQ